MKPFLACDVDISKLKFPVMVFPKIDGGRALNVNDKLVGRSGKQFKNKMNTDFFSVPEFNGFDGEMVVSNITGDGICADTTSAMSTIKGTVETRWCLFDYVIAGENNSSPYLVRYNQLKLRVEEICRLNSYMRQRIWVIPYVMANSVEDVMALNAKYVANGYEGLILRDPAAPYKYGRSTAKEGYYLRLKGFIDTEILVTSIVEGECNQNELKANPNGYAERSTHAENMIPNGMVGALIGTALEDITFLGRVVITKGMEVRIGAGKMSHKERENYFNNPDTIIGKIAKYKFFPVGIKDKPRFPTFQCLRDPVDMS